MTYTIKDSTNNLARKLVDNDYYLNDEVINELDLFLGHFLDIHFISTYNLDRLIDGFVNSKVFHDKLDQPCDYISMIRIDSKCLLSKNWGKVNKFNVNNTNIQSRVYQLFSSSIIHFISGFNGNLPQIPEKSDTFECNNMVLVNEKPIMKVIISSKKLDNKEIEKLSKTYDLIIHGISRIIDPTDFVNGLTELVVYRGVREFHIPDNKESETRLFRDFDKEAAGNLLWLTGIIDIYIGGNLLKEEHEVLLYCATASSITKSSQMADIRKIQAEWIEEQLTDNKDLVATMGHFKGSFNKIMTRAILVSRCRTNEQVIEFFRNNLQDKIALVDDKIIMKCINKSLGRAYERLSKKYDNKPIELLKKFWVFDQDALLIGFKELMRDVKVTIVNCRIDECNNQIVTSFELCTQHLIDAQNKY